MPTLDALVRMKLTSFRLKDKVHLLDLLDVGLIDETWRSRLPAEISTRFEELLIERSARGVTAVHDRIGFRFRFGFHD